MSEPHLALTPDQLHSVQAVLNTFAPGCRALVFGSRVRFDSEAQALKPHADLDIALAGTPLSRHDMFVLRDAFSESDLPFRVDVLMRDDLPAHWLKPMNWVALSLRA